MTECTLKYMKWTDDAITPTRATPRSAGLDLYAPNCVVLHPKTRTLIDTDLTIIIPQGHYARIASRSGLALRHGIFVLAGVVDEDFRGNIGVVLYNSSDIPYCVSKGDRIAQLILEKISYCSLEEVDSCGDTARGKDCYGSSGK